MQVDDWIKAGYRRFNQTTFNYSDYLLQKLFSDEQGKRYYITVYVYENFNKSYNKEGMPEVSFQPEVQFRMEGGQPTVDVQLLMNKDTLIEQVEDRVESLWYSLDCPYCESFNYSEGIHD